MSTPPRPTAKELLADLQSLHQTQLVKIRSLSGEALLTTNPVAAVVHAPHAVGKRKPSLEELESMPTGVATLWRRR